MIYQRKLQGLEESLRELLSPLVSQSPNSAPIQSSTLYQDQRQSLKLCIHTFTHMLSPPPPSLCSIQACTLIPVCAKSNLWTSAGSTGCPSCTTCAPQSAPPPAAPTRRATPSRRTRAACPHTACRGCSWDRTTAPGDPLTLCIGPTASRTRSDINSPVGLSTKPARSGSAASQSASVAVLQTRGLAAPWKPVDSILKELFFF